MNFDFDYLPNLWIGSVRNDAKIHHRLFDVMCFLDSDVMYHIKSA